MVIEYTAQKAHVDEEVRVRSFISFSLLSFLIACLSVLSVDAIISISGSLKRIREMDTCIAIERRAWGEGTETNNFNAFYGP